MLGKPSRRTRKHLEKKGKIAPATVLEIAGYGPTLTDGTGPSRIRTVPLKTTLRIAPKDQAPFEVTQTFRYPKDGEPSKGDELSVIYDPDDHDKVMLDEPEVTEAEVGPELAGTGLGSGRVLSKDQQNEAMGEAQQWLEAFGQGGSGPRSDPVDQLERLSQLKEQGALSDAEFEAEKAKLLGKD